MLVSLLVRRNVPIVLDVVKILQTKTNLFLVLGLDARIQGAAQYRQVVRDIEAALVEEDKGALARRLRLF